MPLITAVDAGKEVILERGWSARNEFIHSVGPIYVKTPRNKPRHCGSCVFVRFRHQDYLITADHVFRERAFGSLWVGGPSKVVEVEGEFAHSSARLPAGTLDPTDIAILAMTDDLKVRLGPIKPIEIASGLTRKPYEVGQRFMVMGYPHSKNKTAFSNPKRLPQTEWAFITRPKHQQTCVAKPNVKETTHIVLDWDYGETIDHEMKPSKPPRLNGMSGGAIFDLGNFSDYGVLAGVTKPKPLLAGILLEFHDTESAIVGIRLSRIIDIVDLASIWPRPLNE